ncbi:unnamed protein product [Nippostrongylus brasiliensis]|uniref:Transposase n=1 Tax=Nippostrongylus brasiliensis TaxID=27835 RepID=A0A0N4YBZ8_NIPBR|nr:unnamed protein product [Nippostrongylus brasiliensis]
MLYPESKIVDESGIRTHAPEGTGALNQRLRPLGHLATTRLFLRICSQSDLSAIVLYDEILHYKRNFSLCIIIVTLWNKIKTIHLELHPFGIKTVNC